MNAKTYFYRSLILGGIFTLTVLCGNPLYAQFGDNLGSHKANKALNMNTKNIDNVGALGYNTLAVSDRSSGGTIGSNVATVDLYSAFLINQTKTNQTLTLPDPTIATAGKVVYVTNTGTASFVLYGTLVPTGSMVGLGWNGSAWVTQPTGGVSALATAANATDGTGGNIAGSTLTLGLATSGYPGLVSTGTQTLAGAKTFADNATLAAGKSLTFTGSTSGTVGLLAPASVSPSYTLMLPMAQASTSGLVLASNGSGGLNWATSTSSPITIQNTSSLFSTGLGTVSSTSTNSIFLGNYAGDATTNAGYSNFIGYQAGQNATEAYQSTFLGSWAGTGATYAANSTFIGSEAGNYATSAGNSVFVGISSGGGATNAQNSSFVGYYAGHLAPDARFSTFMGTESGSNAETAAYSIFIGRRAGFHDLVDNTTFTSNPGEFSSILIGNNTKTGGHTNSILLGNGTDANWLNNTMGNQFMLSPSVVNMQLAGVDYVLPSAQDAGVLTNDGSGVLSWATGGGLKWYAENATAPTTAPVATGAGSVAIGNGAQALGINTFVFGKEAGTSAAVDASNFLGQFAGQSATNANASNFFGSNAGASATNASYSNFLGYNVGNESSAGIHMGSNNIAIGTNISLGAGVSNAMNLGGILFGTGTYATTTGDPSITPVSGGKIGIGTSSPSNMLTLSGDVSNINGPHISFITSADSYPLYQQLNWAHNNISLNFDAYWNGTQTVSSSSSNNYQISKASGVLSFNYATAIAAGSAISSWNTGMVLNSSGNIGIGTATPTSTLQVTGSVAQSIATITAATTLNATYSTVLCNAATAFTVTLPAANTCTGRIYRLIKSDTTTNAVTLSPAITIPGYASTITTFNVPGAVLLIQNNGTNWYKIN